MIEAITAPAYAQAAILVGIVLVEAVVLYLGYGALEDTLAPSVIERIEQA